MRSFEEWAKEEHYDEIFRWWKRWKKGRQKPEPKPASPDEPRWVG